MSTKYILTAPGLTITYTPGVAPGATALTYTSGAFNRSYTEAELSNEDTGLGNLISFSLLLTIDTGGVRYGFFLPFVQVTGHHHVSFSSIGITETFSGPDSFPHRPSTWSCQALHGVAEGEGPIIVPLYAAAVHDAVASGDLAKLKSLKVEAEKQIADLQSGLKSLNDEIAKN